MKYLEYLSIQRAMEADSYTLLNTAVPRKPNIAPDRVNDMQNFFDDIVLLSNFFGVKIFTAKPDEQVQEQHLFYTEAPTRGAYGIGYYDKSTSQFILKKGSKFALQVVPSYKSKDRNEIIANYCKKIDGELVLQQDLPMDTPSGAAGKVLGRPSNGFDVWKDAYGCTLGKFLNR